MVVRFLVMFLLCAYAGSAQTDDLMENISQQSGNSPQYDVIEYLTEHPVPLRTASVKEVARIPTITTALARRIKSFARLRSVEDVADSAGLTIEQRGILLRCAIMEEDKSRSSATTVLYRVRNQQVLGEQAGFSNGAYLGSPLDVYQRLTLNSPYADANILTNKDAGEQSVTDFVSGYVDIKLIKNLTLVAGDFNVEFGLGGILWKNFGSRKGTDVIAPATQAGSGVQPYRSTLDFRFFRGVGAGYDFNIGSVKTSVTAFASRLPRTASIDPFSGAVTSLDVDGQYRTASERAKRNAITESASGATLLVTSGNLTLGAAALALGYDKPIASSSVSAFAGSSGVLRSLYVAYSAEKLTIGAEISQDNNANTGIKAGVEYNNEKVHCAAGYRYFAPEFRSPFGYNFGEYLTPNNESGIYLAWLLRTVPKLQLLGYADVYQSPALRFGIPALVRGFDMLGEARWSATRRTTILARMRYESKTDGMSIEGRSIAYQRTNTSLRVEAQNAISDQWQLRLRGEATSVDFEEHRPRELGIAGFCELTYTPNEWLRIGGRYGLYSTDSFFSAIYSFELAAPGVFATAPLYEQGNRSFLYVRIIPAAWCTVWMRYAATTRMNTRSLGSGTTETEGNTDRRLLLQCDILW
ncbi:MAG: hypothetical protein JNL32_02010 [Candidatus Kapabacteria bacterium]|nr:hypothetical protein [Candidatus Kapabacteria bacterium]